MGNAETTLADAARLGNLEDVRKLVTNGVNVDTKDENGRTALMCSIEGGHIDVARFLLEQGATLDAKMPYGSKLLLCCADEDRLDMVRLLINSGAAVNAADGDGRTPLILSALRGHIDVISFLLEHGAAVNAADKFGSTPLLYSAEEGYLDVVRILLNRGAALDATDDGGLTPLMHSAKRGHLDVVRFLVDRGAALETTSKFGSTPLMFCAKRGHFDMVRFLVERGAAVNAVNKLNMTSLLYSAYRGDLDVVRYLVYQGASLNAADKMGRTPLMHSAFRGYLNVVSFLMECGANLSMPDDDGDTPLICLLRSHSNENELIPVVIQMLSKGASPTHCNKKGKSAVVLARDIGFRQLEQVLNGELQPEPSPSSNGNTGGISSSMNHIFLLPMAPVSQLASNNETNIGDVHDPWQLAGNGISGVAGSNNDFSTHLEAGSGHVSPAISSPPIINLETDNDDSKDDSLMAMLKYVEDRCNLLNEAAPLYQHVLSRLQLLADSISRMDPGDKIVAETVADIRAISTRLKSLLDANVNMPVVSRLVSVRSVVETLTSFRTDLDRLETICSNLKVCEWSAKWEEHVALVRQSIVAQTESSLSTMIDELSSHEQQTKAMTMLIFELSRRKKYYSHRELELMQLVHIRIVGYSKLRGMDLEGWFIPRHEVDIRFGVLLGRGSFGVVYRGMWRKSEVVVKMLTSKSETDKRNFFREVEVWHRIRHRNIVRFLGACHLSSPYFMVCEYAPGGSLPEYLYRMRQNGKGLVWRKLHEVSLGLFYLHEEGIVHGDLKGDNILVAKDETAMLTDFGLSFVQSATVATLDNWGAIRWRAPEYVVQGSVGPSFAADVYSLAMVIVEAVTGQAPWGLMPDIAVTMCLRKKEMLRKPTKCVEMTNEAWDLVSRMSVYEPSERMALSDVVDRLKEFAEDEEEREWQPALVE